MPVGCQGLLTARLQTLSRHSFAILTGWLEHYRWRACEHCRWLLLPDTHIASSMNQMDIVLSVFHRVIVGDVREAIRR